MTLAVVGRTRNSLRSAARNENHQRRYDQSEINPILCAQHFLPPQTTISDEIRFGQTALRRPLNRLMTKTTSPTTSSKWIRPPPTCRLKPKSHKIRSTTQIVQSIVTSSAHLSTPEELVPQEPVNSIRHSPPVY